MPQSIVVALGLRGASNLNPVEQLLSFLNTGLFGNFILVGLRRGAKKPQEPGRLERTVSVRQPIPPWQVVYGQARVGGDVTFIFLGTDKRYLHIVVTLACHASEEIGDVWLDDEIVTPGMLDANGVVISGKFSRSNPTVYRETVTTNPYTVAHPVGSVQSVANILKQSFTDVSPNTPGEKEYKRSGSTFTFNSNINLTIPLRIHYTDNVPVPICRIRKSLGTESVQPFTELVSESESKWTDAHRQTGHTKIYIRFDTSVLESGPPNISAVVKGKKLYDPRTGTTVWSANPALAVLDYLTSTDYGLGADRASETSSADFISAANLCDERVLLGSAPIAFTADPASDALTFPAGSKLPFTGETVRVSSTATLPSPLAAATTYYTIRASGTKLATTYANALAGTAIDITTAGSGTHSLDYYDEARYTANGSFHTSERPVDVLERLLDSMAGVATQISDTWRVFPGAYEAATITLSEDDFAGPIQIDPMPARQEWANGAKGVFVNPRANWQPTDFPAIPGAAYLALDGGERIWVDLDFSAFVTSSATAQRLAKIELLRRRDGLSFTALFKLTAWRVMTGHSVAISFAKYGWTPLEFSIVDAGFAVIDSEQGPALGVQLTLRKTAAAHYAWTAEEQTQVLPPSTSLPNPFALAAPGAPAVIESLYETSGSAGVKSRATVSWTAVTDPLAKSYEVSWKEIEDADYKIVPVPTGTALNVDDLGAGLFLFAVRAYNGIVRSAWSPYTTKTLLGLTVAPSDATGFSMIASNGFAVARWDLSPDLDVKIGGRAIIRHSPLTTGATWEDGILISGTVDLPGFPGDTVMSPPLPLKTGTYLLKFRDSSGNYSVNAASFVATEGMITGFTTLVTITEDAAFTGTKTDLVVNGSNLQLASVNMLQRTEEFDNAVWSKFFGASIVADAGVAPDGTTTADKIVFDGTAFGQVTQGVSGLVIGNPYTFSVYVKTDGTTQQQQQLFCAGSFQDFTPTSNWTRISLLRVAAATSEPPVIVNVPTGASSFLAWGAQFEKGSVASTYDKLVADRIGSVVTHAGSYAFAATDDRGSIAVRRFEATVKAVSFDTGDTIDSRTANIDTWDSIDGGIVNDCNIQMLASVSDDNITYKPFTPFHVADFSGRYSKFRADFTSASSNHNIAASQLRVAIKVP
jgi:hypothetical protein